MSGYLCTQHCLWYNYIKKDSMKALLYTKGLLFADKQLCIVMQDHNHICLENGAMVGNPIEYITWVDFITAIPILEVCHHKP